MALPNVPLVAKRPERQAPRGAGLGQNAATRRRLGAQLPVVPSLANATAHLLRAAKVAARAGQVVGTIGRASDALVARSLDPPATPVPAAEAATVAMAAV